MVGSIPSGTSRLTFECRVATWDYSRINFDSDWTLEDRTAALWSGLVSLPIEAVATIDDAIEPVDGLHIDGLMKRALATKIMFLKQASGYKGWISIRLDRTVAPVLAEIAFGLSLDFLCDGETVENIRVPPDPSSGFWSARTPEPNGSAWFTALDPSLADDPTESSRWTIRIRGDGEMALRDWDRDKYWAGEFTVPLCAVLK